ncbi:hypothetical protein IFM89_022378 [Coptis chinensis]|uniref:Uncharacterized protein n=1 Tax=Coptis chinensis TaxID=261450 RepID=A0A835J1F8_9MAGN|nr:hypothetical protein IFM89_022378 [Coptis chinensis]
MRTSAIIKHTPLSIAFVESGSTHNFIHPTAARRCGLSITSYATLQVMIADGGYLPSNGVCSCVKVEVQGFSFTTNFTVLAIKSCDIVLGTKWLRTLGCIQWDFGHELRHHMQNAVKSIQANETTYHWGTNGAIQIASLASIWILFQENSFNG